MRFVSAAYNMLYDSIDVITFPSVIRILSVSLKIGKRTRSYWHRW